MNESKTIRELFTSEELTIIKDKNFISYGEYWEYLGIADETLGHKAIIILKNFIAQFEKIEHYLYKDMGKNNTHDSIRIEPAYRGKTCFSLLKKDQFDLLVRFFRVHQQTTVDELYKKEGWQYFLKIPLCINRLTSLKKEIEGKLFKG